MSSIALLERTTDQTKTGISITSEDRAEEDIKNQYPKIEVGGNVETSDLVWKSSIGPLSWMVSGLEEEESKLKDVKPPSIWNKPNIEEMLRQPVGTTIVLTKDEAREIASLAFGSNPNLIPGEDYVRWLRPLFGRAILRKVQRAGGRRAI